jgi:hypothetical protein
MLPKIKPKGQVWLLKGVVCITYKLKRNEHMPIFFNKKYSSKLKIIEYPP